jgi:hypothetical protein
MLQNWAPGSLGGQLVNPSILSSAPQAIQLLQAVPQQLQQLQQIEYIRLQQLQQIQQLVQYAAYQLQILAQHQSPQLPLGAYGPQVFGQAFGQSLGSIGGSGLQSAFQPSPHVM